MSLNVFKGFEYEPNEMEMEIFLSDVPLKLMEENIKLQFDDPVEHRKNDLVQTYINSYKYTKEEMTIDDEDTVNDLSDEFLSFMLETFRVYLGIGFPAIEDLSENDQYDLIHYVYRFFIMNIKRNFVNIVLNYIEKYKDKLVSELPKKKDVATLSLSKIVDDEDDLIILSNLEDVINIIFEDPELYDVENFLELCARGESNLEVEYIDEKYDSLDVTGNFTEKYCAMVDNDFKVTIECKVRNKLISKYT